MADTTNPVNIAGEMVGRAWVQLHMYGCHLTVEQVRAVLETAITPNPDYITP